MATDGTLLQGDISDSASSPLLDGAHVEQLLAGFMKALVSEQLTDLRREAAGPVDSPSATPPAESKPVHQSPAESRSREQERPALKFIRGGREGNA